jgi:hypothetical protein
MDSIYYIINNQGGTMPIDSYKERVIQTFLSSGRAPIDRAALCEKLSKQDLVDGLIAVYDNEIPKTDKKRRNKNA